MDEKTKMIVYDHITYLVKQNNLTSVLTYYDTKSDTEDIIHDAYARFFDLKLDERWNPDKGKSLQSYLFTYVGRFIWIGIRDAKSKLGIVDDKDKVGVEDVKSKPLPFEEYVEMIDVSGSSPEEELLDKEIMGILDELNYGGDENREYTEGTPQAEIGRKQGEIRSIIYKRIKKQRKKLQKQWRSYDYTG